MLLHVTLTPGMARKSNFIQNAVVRGVRSDSAFGMHTSAMSSDPRDMFIIDGGDSDEDDGSFVYIENQLVSKSQNSLDSDFSFSDSNRETGELKL